MANIHIICQSFLNKLIMRNRQFNLSKEQWDKYDKWVKSLPKKYYGADSNGITIYFPNWSIGVLVRAKRDEGEEIDLTDWDNV